MTVTIHRDHTTIHTTIFWAQWFQTLGWSDIFGKVRAPRGA